MNKRIKLSIISTCTFWLFACSPVKEDFHRGQTAFRIEHLTSAIECLHGDGVHVSRYSSITDLVSESRKRGLLSPYEEWDKDYIGNELLMRIALKEDRTTICIFSTAKWLPQHENDLWVRITLLPNGVSKAIYGFRDRKENQEGKTKQID